MKHMLLCVSVALGLSLSVTISGHAFSIGEIHVQSQLHTPFVAEVPLIMKPHERDQGFVVVIGDERDYKAEGVTREPAIEILRPSIIMGQSDVIRIISTEPIDVPAFDLLLLVRTGKVTIVQNYPVALTGPKPGPMMAKVMPPTAKPARPAKMTRPEKDAPQAKSKKQHTAPPVSAEWLANMPAQYGPILRGEVLYKVMKRLRVPKPYIWQVAVQIWEHNRDHLIRSNLHGLRIGVYLKVPDDLSNSLSALSQREAQRMVAAQWDAWQKPAEMAVASAVAPSADKGNSTKPAPTEPAATSPEAVVFSPKTDMSSPVNMATLESMLQGFERRLAQRLSLPAPNTDAPDEHAITFVSTDELHTAMQGLEARLILQLDTGQRPAGVWRHGAASRKPSLRVGMQTALASFLSADSFVYVFIVQNVILLLIAAGIAWRWYRKRPEH